ncbi:hypothetical protein GCM10007878_24750 [Marinospirillum insulare]|uniref:Uncharacterized protein n=1 Tax=Marinospirillum insulare TaxID=217169 RepID=A0ABQ5ZZT1_9GAMM|nr:hypothetical protein GCM10007878_24750 [Marinospirillum insulare]
MINLSMLDKELGNGVNNFSLVMKVEATIFTTTESKKDYQQGISAAQKSNLTSASSKSSKK